MRSARNLCRLLAALCLASGALGMVGAGEARAHYYDHTLERWLFHGATFNKDGHDEKRDPVNMMIWPYAKAANTGFFDRIHTHFKQHWRKGSWSRGSELPNHVKCKGNTIMRFRAVVHVWPENDDHGVGLDRPQQDAGLIPDECATRWHTRLWSDNHILHNSSVDGSPVADGHRGNGDYAASFAVGNFHYEVQDGYLGLKCGAPSVCVPRYNRIHHSVNKRAWDATTNTIVERMRALPKSAAHADAHGKPDMGHCATKRWKVLPGSGRPHYTGSDGILARVSMLHCPRT